MTLLLPNVPPSHSPKPVLRHKEHQVKRLKPKPARSWWRQKVQLCWARTILFAPLHPRQFHRSNMQARPQARRCSRPVTVACAAAAAVAAVVVAARLREEASTLFERA